MNKKNQKGFTLILSLVLLLVMSLMGGSLIVISSGDHQSNNTSDEYQKTFYVAEHALIEAEKYIINEMIGPWVDPQSPRIVAPGAGASNEELDAHAEYLNTINTQATANGGFARHTDASAPWPQGRGTPVNINTGADTPCLNSFRNLIRNDAGDVILAFHSWAENWNFGEVIRPILESENASNDEISYMQRYRWEFFVINAGSANFRGAGTSLKKTSTNVQRQGTVFKIYGCGYLMPSGTALDDIDDPEILIPLESVVILSS